MRSSHPGARALIIAALIGTLGVSLAPASIATAVEPDAVPVTEPAADPAPVTDPAPVVEPAPVAEPVPVAEPAPSSTPPLSSNPRRPRPTSRPRPPRSRSGPRRSRSSGSRSDRSATRGGTAPAALAPSTAPGLVIYAFKRAGDSRAIGRGHLASARALYHWFKAHHKASRHHPKVGDLVIWGGGTHVGIYIGHGKAISTLTNGVHIHRVHAVTARFTTYLHTGMWKKAAS